MMATLPVMMVAMKLIVVTVIQYMNSIVVMEAAYKTLRYVMVYISAQMVLMKNLVVPILIVTIYILMNVTRIRINVIGIHMSNNVGTMVKVNLGRKRMMNSLPHACWVVQYLRTKILIGINTQRFVLP